MRVGIVSSSAASPCVPSVYIPACQPVSDSALTPMLSSVIAISAAERCSPVLISASSSRAGGALLIVCASSISPSVVSPIADTTMTTLCPLFRAAMHMPAARRSLSASARELPPNFCTISILILHVRPRPCRTPPGGC